MKVSKQRRGSEYITGSNRRGAGSGIDRGLLPSDQDYAAKNYQSPKEKIREYVRKYLKKKYTFEE